MEDGKPPHGRSQLEGRAEVTARAHEVVEVGWRGGRELEDGAPREAAESVAALRRQVEALRRELDALRAEQAELQREQQTFLQLVAHNVKSPVLPLEVSLRAIQRAIERGRPLPPDALRRALRQIKRMYRTVDALLVDLPNVDAGSLRVCPARFDLREAVRGVVDELAALLEARTFVLRLPAEPVTVHCDAQRVGHIVASLLDNAVKYSPEPAPVEVTLACADGEAIVAIIDRGIGIPTWEIDQVGTRFYRGSNAPSYLYRGLGVGLYLARAFAELCQGRLRIESEEGRGTRAELVLPLSRDI